MTTDLVARLIDFLKGHACPYEHPEAAAVWIDARDRMIVELMAVRVVTQKWELNIDELLDSSQLRHETLDEFMARVRKPVAPRDALTDWRTAENMAVQNLRSRMFAGVDLASGDDRTSVALGIEGPVERVEQIWADGETVRIPTSEAEAALMSILGTQWLEDHAPKRLRASFQDRVDLWMLECFGAGISRDIMERNHRFLEESLELVQASGCTAAEAHQLVDYVFGRPVGCLEQELGGVMVTLAALCNARKMNITKWGEAELARVWTKIPEIRAKQAGKPKHSPLPQEPRPEALCDALGCERIWVRSKLKGHGGQTREYSFCVEHFERHVRHDTFEVKPSVIR